MQSSLRWCTAEIQERSEGCYKLCGNNRGMWKTRTFWGARQVSPSSPQSGRTIEESWSWKNWGTRTTSTECISRIQRALEGVERSICKNSSFGWRLWWLEHETLDCCQAYATLCMQKVWHWSALWAWNKGQGGDFQHSNAQRSSRNTQICRNLVFILQLSAAFKEGNLHHIWTWLYMVSAVTQTIQIQPTKVHHWIEKVRSSELVNSTFRWGSILQPLRPWESRANQRPRLPNFQNQQMLRN